VADDLSHLLSFVSKYYAVLVRVGVKKWLTRFRRITTSKVDGYRQSPFHAWPEPSEG
jgi:hypothetical protein